MQLMRGGRARWKIENENNNVLKTKGYHFEHNFGHGKTYLSATLLSLNLLAFLFHTVLEWSDAPYALVRQELVRRVNAGTPIAHVAKGSLEHRPDDACDLVVPFRGRVDAVGLEELGLLGDPVQHEGKKRDLHAPAKASSAGCAIRI